MRYKAIIEYGRLQQIDTIREITHAVVGQRNEEAERPAGFRKDPETLTPQENEANAQFRVKRNAGYYNMGVLDWYESESAARTALNRWPNLINVRIVITTRTANG